MAATRPTHRFLLVALGLSLLGLGLMIGDKITNANIAHRGTFDLLQFVFAALALVLGVIVVVRGRRVVEDPDDDMVIDLRERLRGHVDLDDDEIDQPMDSLG